MAVLSAVFFASCTSTPFGGTTPSPPSAVALTAPSAASAPVAAQAAASPSPDRTGLAPDDAGDLRAIHDHTFVKNGVGSTFVWIPPFEAYQLIAPGRCGPANAAKPVGYWVQDQPAAGVENVDWARERFGGFYAGKYEASHADAVPGDATTGALATEGAASLPKVAANCVPWTGISYADAVGACRRLDPHADLMADDEWTALAVWAAIHGVKVEGNNNYLKDAGDPGTTFADDPNVPWDATPGVPAYWSRPDGRDRALTGTGTNPAWAGDTNLTTHSGTKAGVYDLGGNVGEWTGTVGLGTGMRWIVGLRELAVSAPATGSVTGLATDPAARRFGLPGATATESAADLAGTSFSLIRFDDTPRSARGGTWASEVRASLWRITFAPGWSQTGFRGFRPVLRY